MVAFRLQVGKRCILKSVPESPNDIERMCMYACSEVGNHSQIVDVIKTKEGYSATFLQNSREIYSYLERTDNLSSEMTWQDKTLLLDLITVAQSNDLGVKTANEAILRLQIPPQPNFRGDITLAQRLIAMAGRKKWDIEVEWDHECGWDRFIIIRTPVIQDVDYPEIAKDLRDSFEFKGKQYTRVKGVVYVDKVPVLGSLPLVKWTLFEGSFSLPLN